jgi:hypothetical protein
MSFTDERLVELLPAVYGLRDGDDGPLHELLGVVADQLAVLEESVAQLHDDQFVETCAPWVLPYMGELLGIAGLPPSPLTPRAEVAHTIAYRRRKGTAAVLEQLARDVTGLPAAAVELFELLCATQHLNHLRPGCESFLSLGDTLRLEALGGPFERRPQEPALTHTVDVRRIAGHTSALRDIAGAIEGVARDTGALGELRADMAAVARSTATIEPMDARMATIEQAMPVLVEVQQHLALLPETMDRLEQRIDRLAGALDTLLASLETLSASVDQLQGAVGPLGRLAGRLPGQRR